VRQEQSWRLKAQLKGGALEELAARVQGPDVDATEWLLPSDVVVTHDGNALFAYAASERSIQLARKAVEALPHQATILISHWDEQLDDWLQVDPPPAGQTKQHADQRAAGSVETRTMVASAGRLVRREIEEVMHETAANLDLQLTVTEHRHLLTCQVLFQVTGPKRKIDEFAEGLKAYELATMRTELAVMMSPL
jgi:hypothetical protein